MYLICVLQGPVAWLSKKLAGQAYVLYAGEAPLVGVIPESAVLVRSVLCRCCLPPCVDLPRYAFHVIRGKLLVVLSPKLTLAQGNLVLHRAFVSGLALMPCRGMRAPHNIRFTRSKHGFVHGRTLVVSYLMKVTRPWINLRGLSLQRYLRAQCRSLYNVALACWALDACDRTGVKIRRMLELRLETARAMPMDAGIVRFRETGCERREC